MLSCGLKLHPEKTGIVYCGTASPPPGQKPKRKFTFLGFDFQPLRVYVKHLGKGLITFGGRVAKKARQHMLSEFRSYVKRGAVSSLAQWSARLTQKLRGWQNYYSCFTKWELRSIFGQLNHRLTRWVMKSYKRFKYSYDRARSYLRKLCEKEPNLFAHWQWGFKP